MFMTVPSWVRKGAVLDFDFAGGRYYGGYVSYGSGLGAGDRAKSWLTSGSDAVAGVNYSLDINTGLLVAQLTTASLRIVPGTGLYSETDTSNTCLWCRDQTNAAWVKVTMTAAKDQAGMTNVANSASSLTATSPLATSLQSITSASNFRAFSAYVKRITGTGTINITIDGTTWTDITSQINSTTYTRVYITATSANPIVGFQISTSGDKIAVDFCQQEALNGAGAPLVPTSPQLTTSAATTRINNLGGTEEAFFATPGTTYNNGIRWINDIVKGRPTSFVMSGAGNAPSSTACLACGVDAGGYFVNNCFNGLGYLGASGAVAGITNVNKIAYTRNGAGEKICINANSITSGGTPITNTQGTHGGIGNRGAGDSSINGYVSRVTYWARELSDGEMMEYTR